MAQAEDLIGLGSGPFHLSLAALAAGVKNLSCTFLERKEQFEWHSELGFADALMQTTYLKDLVTPVDPTSPYSFLNYLVQNRSFYAFLNTGRQVILRREFEEYCRWVSRQLPSLRFSHHVQNVRFDGGRFRVETDRAEFLAKNLSIATGPRPFLPDCARPFVSSALFHAKSSELQSMNLEGKRLAIVGGGQTGAEIFLNALRGLWGQPKSITWISRRMNLEALDESAFTNEYFSPAYVEGFYSLPPSVKANVVAKQKLASDGITSTYLLDIYRELYLRRTLGAASQVQILCGRELSRMRREGSEFTLDLQNMQRETQENAFADQVVMATGFRTELPPCLEGLFSRLSLDAQGRPEILPSFRLVWDGPASSRIYALNFGRHSHGIAEPQTSLMAWRSATILNDLLPEAPYRLEDKGASFVGI